MKTHSLVLCLGNPQRGDDATGCVAAEHLRRDGMAGAEIRTCAGDGASLIQIWGRGDRVVLVDAVVSGAPPGTIHRADLIASALPPDLFPVSTHAFGVRDGIELARALGLLPSALLFFGVEGTSFGAGQPLSPAVERAIPALVERVREAACSFAQGDNAGAGFSR